MKTQNELILDYMKKIGPITSLKAFQDLGITRISARIYDLRAEGHPIISTNVNVLRRDGSITTVAEYSLETGK